MTMDETAAIPIRVLIVDDDEIIADLLRELIESPDRTVAVCHDGLEAIKQVQDESFDLIIADLVMPRIGGLDVLKFVKKIHPETIVIIVTGYASLETAMSAIRDGAYDYIRKPCKLEEMRVVVDRATDKISIDRENRALLQKLQVVCHDMSGSEELGYDIPRRDNLRIYSSDHAGLNHLFDRSSPGTNDMEKLHALSALRENGMLTEGEFAAFKKHLLNAIDTKGPQTRAINE